MARVGLRGREKSHPGSSGTYRTGRRVCSLMDEDTRELTRAEGVILFDEAAQRLLGISGEEFLVRWDLGYYDNDENHSEVLRLQMLIPFVR